MINWCHLTFSTLSTIPCPQSSNHSFFLHTVCTDCAGVDTEGEIEASLIVVAIILIIFLTVCSCQCYQKFSWELRSRPGCTSDPDSDKKPMPMAPYMRDNARNNNNNNSSGSNLISTSNGVNFTVNYPNYCDIDDGVVDDDSVGNGDGGNNKNNGSRNNYYSPQYIP